MSFTAKLISVDKRDSYSELLVEFVDGNTIKQKSIHHSGTIEEFVALLRSKVAKREVVKGVDFTPFIGKIIDLTPKPVTPPPDPTPEEIAKIAWFKDWRKLDRLIHLANNGLIQPDDSRITALQTTLKTDWVSSYLGDI